MRLGGWLGCLGGRGPRDKRPPPLDLTDPNVGTEEEPGMQEPPVTPVGRDELALKRHRFFAELMAASQTTHRVRFDPRGPSFSGESEEGLLGKHSTELDALLTRLEAVIVRLEDTIVSIQPASTPPSILDIWRPETPTPPVEMSVQGFRDLLEGPLSNYLQLSHKIGGDVAKHSDLVQQAFAAQLDYLEVASNRSEPSQGEQVNLLGPTSRGIQAVQEHREKNRTSPHFNHLSAVSESIPALGWVTVKPAPAPYVKEMSDTGQFYTNRVLKDWKEKDKTHVEWVKAWLETLGTLQRYVKEEHTTGLVWRGSSGGPPPPPPPAMVDLSISPPPAEQPGTDRSALFAQINQGENITRSLKKVTSDMQTHKNPGLRTGPAPFKAPSPTSSSPGAMMTTKAPVFAREGKKWLIEHHKGNQNLVVENAEMNNVVYMFACQNSTLTVKGKINSVFLDSCHKTSVLFDTLVSSIEFVNCQSCQMQVLGKVPTISIDKTDGCQMYLNPESLDVEIVSSKSSEMNVLVPKPNGDYVEYPIPEQYKTTVRQGGLLTSPVENKG